MTFAERLKELRNEKGKSQKEMANELTFSIPTLSHWECGYQEPSFKDLITLCRYFQVSTDYLLGLTSDDGAELYSLPTVGVMHDGTALSEKEKALLTAFKNLLPETQDFILRTAQSFSDSGKKSLNKS
ncbi:MAG: helix-turn-helix domain-containing protein [Clostridia bacterium]|nr:helix-turn-helix domain-containing protein [Clostridia bacterium]